MTRWWVGWVKKDTSPGSGVSQVRVQGIEGKPPPAAYPAPMSDKATDGELSSIQEDFQPHLSQMGTRGIENTRRVCIMRGG